MCRGYIRIYNNSTDKKVELEQLYEPYKVILSDDIIRDSGTSGSSKSKPEKALERSRKVVPKRKDRRKKTTKSS